MLKNKVMKAMEEKLMRKYAKQFILIVAIIVAFNFSCVSSFAATSGVNYIMYGVLPDDSFAEMEYVENFVPGIRNTYIFLPGQTFAIFVQTAKNPLSVYVNDKFATTVNAFEIFDYDKWTGATVEVELTKKNRLNIYVSEPPKDIEKYVAAVIEEENAKANKNTNSQATDDALAKYYEALEKMDKKPENQSNEDALAQYYAALEKQNKKKK